MTEYALVIPGLDGYQGLLRGVAPDLLPGLEPLYFDHMRHEGADGADGAESMADGSMALLDSVAGEGASAIVIGESFGGTVALAIARRYPERVRGLVLLSTFAWYPHPHRRATAAGLRLWDALGDDAAQLLLRLGRVLGLASQLGLPVRPALLRSYLAWQMPALATYRRRVELSLEFDARPWLHEVQVPTLVVGSHNDPVVPVAAGRELAARLPRAQYLQLHRSHLPHITRAAEVGAAITRWRTAILADDTAPSSAATTTQ